MGNGTVCPKCNCLEIKDVGFNNQLWCEHCHYSWINNAKTRDKIKYQTNRWGVCSYKYNEQTDSIELDSLYYQQNKEKVPIIYCI